MVIIVDAYNLLRAVPPYKKTITESERKRFIAQLHKYGRIKGHKMVVVFDGGSYEWPFKEQYTGLLIVYSGINDSADDYIREYIGKHRSQELLLVTSDRELNDYAAQRSIPSIDSVAFNDLLFQATKSVTIRRDRHPQVIKTTAQECKDVDLLMQTVGQQAQEKAEDLADQNHHRASKKYQSTKEERKLLKKLKKL